MNNMANYTEIKLDLAICRICGHNDGVTYLFDTNFEPQPSSKIMHCSRQVDIFKGDGLPEWICTTCLEELDGAYQFVLKCEATNMKLHSLRSNALSESELDEPEVKFQVKANNIADDVKTIFEDGHRLETYEHAIDTYTHTSEDDKVVSINNIKLEEQDISDDNYQKECNRHVDNVIIPITFNTELAIKPMRQYTTEERIISRPLICNVCKYICKTKSMLSVHMRKHTETRPFACDICDKTYKNPGSLHQHKISHGKNKKIEKFICDHCNKSFCSKSTIRIHLRIHSGERPFICSLCPMKFITSWSLNQHMHTHTGKKKYQCTKCSKQFRCVSNLRIHEKIHAEKREEHVCKTCNKSLKSLKNLKTHLNIHKNPNSAPCTLCGRTFNSQTALVTHTSLWHSEKSGYCEICTKNVKDLEVHMRKHSGKPLKCDYCNVSSFNAGCLKSHMKHRHFNHDANQCSFDGCTEKFPSPTMLKYHIAKFHKKEKPFKCDLCSRAFYRKGDYSRHYDHNHK